MLGYARSMPKCQKQCARLTWHRFVKRVAEQTPLLPQGTQQCKEKKGCCREASSGMSQTLSPTPSEFQGLSSELGRICNVPQARCLWLITYYPGVLHKVRIFWKLLPCPATGPLDSHRGAGEEILQPSQSLKMTSLLQRVSHSPRTCDDVYDGPGVITTRSQALEAAHGIHLALWAEISVWVLTTLT